MRRLTRVVSETAPAARRSSSETVGPTLTIGYEDRRRSRWRACLDDGAEVAILLPYGIVLRDGDSIWDEATGEVVAIRAAPETLSVARTDDPHLLTRAAYHLGNRHVPLQISPGRLAYQHDHVLDRLVRELGLDLMVISAPFEPEAGGYKHGGNQDAPTHAHRQGHEHDHDEHDHEHGQPDEHDHDHHSPRRRHDH